MDDEYGVNENLSSAGYEKLSSDVSENDNGIEKLKSNGKDMYVAYAKLSNGFTIFISVPVSEVAEDAEVVAENTGRVQMESGKLKSTSGKLSMIIERFKV